MTTKIATDNARHARAAASYLWRGLKIPGSRALVTTEVWLFSTVQTFAAGRSRAISLLAQWDSWVPPALPRFDGGNEDFEDDEITEVRCVTIAGLGQERRPWSQP